MGLIISASLAIHDSHRQTWTEEQQQELLPRIDIQDVVRLVIEKKRSVLFVDGRPDDEYQCLGSIRNSVRLDDTSDLPTSLFSSANYAVIVVHDIELANRLLVAHVPRLCTLIGCSLPPDFYISHGTQIV
jgi:hypothetical protein